METNQNVEVVETVEVEPKALTLLDWAERKVAEMQAAEMTQVMSCFTASVGNARDAVSAAVAELTDVSDPAAFGKKIFLIGAGNVAPSLISNWIKTRFEVGEGKTFATEASRKRFVNAVHFGVREAKRKVAGLKRDVQAHLGYVDEGHDTVTSTTWTSRLKKVKTDKKVKTLEEKNLEYQAKFIAELKEQDKVRTAELTAKTEEAAANKKRADEAEERLAKLEAVVAAMQAGKVQP